MCRYDTTHPRSIFHAASFICYDQCRVLMCKDTSHAASWCSLLGLANSAILCRQNWHRRPNMTEWAKLNKFLQNSNIYLSKISVVLQVKMQWIHFRLGFRQHHTWSSQEEGWDYWHMKGGRRPDPWDKGNRKDRSVPKLSLYLPDWFHVFIF